MTPLVGTVSPQVKMDMHVKLISKEIGPAMTALIAAIAKSTAVKSSSVNTEQAVQIALQKLGWTGE